MPRTASAPGAVSLVGHGLVDWAGGRDFLAYVGRGLALLPEARAGLELLLPQANLAQRAARRAAQALADLAFHARALRSPLLFMGPEPAALRQWLADTSFGATQRFLADSAAAVRRHALRSRPRVMLPFLDSPGPDFPVPWVGYVFDLQHHHLPHLFRPLTRARRDRRLRRMLADAPVVIVNSRAVAADIARFLPGHRARLVVQPFCPALDPRLLSPGDPALAARHAGSAPHFLVCNQTWVHKDHATAIRAMRIFAERGGDPAVQLLCTGATRDHRDPRHFDFLTDLVRREGLHDRVRFLGLLPKPEQIALMRKAVALVQPTLFEGGPGGGATYDAVSIGQRAILSDIPVNREIDSSLVTFFAAGDAEALAGKMLEAWRTPHALPSFESLVEQGARRIEARAAPLAEAIRWATAGRSA